MASGQQAARAALSLLDRLFDPQPAMREDAPSTRGEASRQFQAALCRDVSALLNTRRAEADFDPAYEEASHSLLRFGIRDFTSSNLTSGAAQEAVRLSIERAIREFEPRLELVSVSVEPPDPIRPELQFQVEATLCGGPAAGLVVFDVRLQRETGRMTVSGRTR